MNMKGYSFTFGAYRRLDDIDIVRLSTSLSPRREGVLKMKCCLKHPIFGIDGVMEVVRDYLPCGALLPTDLFPSRTVTTNEIYQTLYSVACCERCTRDVLCLLINDREFIPLSKVQILHLIYRCQFLKNDANLQIYRGILIFPGDPLNTVDMIKSTSIYSSIKFATCAGSHYNHNLIKTIEEGIKLRVAGRHHIDVMVKRIDESCIVSVDDLMIVILFGRRAVNARYCRDVKAIRRVFGAKEYYHHVISIRYTCSILGYEPALRNLGLEEMIVLSLMEYDLFHFPPARGLFGGMAHMWILPRRILQENCDIIYETHSVSSTGVTIEYGTERKQYTMHMESRRYTDASGVEKTKVMYICSNGVEYSYMMLLLIIAKRFLFTYDRDHIINIILKVCTPDQIALEHLDIPSSISTSALRDLICPPDVFSSLDFIRDIHSVS